MPNKVVALTLSTHPGPTVGVTVVTVILGLGIQLDPWRLALLGGAMLANQLSVGLSNDWMDADRDTAVGRRDKPIARGWVAPGTVKTAAFSCLVLAIALTVPLGWAATAVQTLFLASAWAYNAGLKRSWASVAPYVLSFGLLPALVTLSRPEPSWAAGWAIGAGALLGIAAHFANVLPDLEDDRATGIAGLPHRLGRPTSGVTIALSLAAAALLVALGPAGEPSAGMLVGLGASLLLAVICVVLALRSRPPRLLFFLIIAAALIDVTMLALSGEATIA